MAQTAAQRRKAASALKTAQQSSVRLRQALRQYERVLGRAEILVGERRAVSEVLDDLDFAEMREELGESLIEFEDARRRMRTDLMTLGRSQGISIAEQARLWGFSRQLAARLLREASRLEKEAGSGNRG